MRRRNKNPEGTRASVRKSGAAWRKNNPEKVLRKGVVGKLKSRFGIRAHLIPTSLVEAKIAHILVLRLIKELRKPNITPGAPSR